ADAGAHVEAVLAGRVDAHHPGASVPLDPDGRPALSVVGGEVVVQARVLDASDRPRGAVLPRAPRVPGLGAIGGVAADRDPGRAQVLAGERGEGEPLV